MGESSSIEWTDHTFNPWWGCQRVSPGCERCYAETFANRLGLKVWGPTSDRRFFGAKHWANPIEWDRMADRDGVRARVFCASMADVFEDRRDLDEPRARLWRTIEQTPHLDWQLLTKRPENMRRLSPTSWQNKWPRNVWAGCTAEDQKRADERIPELINVPASIRFVSYEPAIGPVDFGLLRLAMGTDDDVVAEEDAEIYGIGTGPIDWVIVGGESGPGSRSFDLAWARSVIAQCKRAGVAVFFKQAGAAPVDSQRRCGSFADSDKRFIARSKALGIDLVVGPNLVVLRDRKGGDLAELPEEFHVREFPEPPS